MSSSPPPRPLVAGNWKMNGLQDDVSELRALIAALAARQTPPPCEILLCPPATLIADFARTAAPEGGGAAAVGIGAQDCHPAPGGPHTGGISAPMLKDAGARAVLLGHSERRAEHGETGVLIRAKATAALEAGLHVILCVGETAEQRPHAADVISRQLEQALPAAATACNTAIAYEPVWAIGTGQTPDPAAIGAICAHVRGILTQTCGPAAALRILYGGSVGPGNVAAILHTAGHANVNGVLAGGASLRARSFLGIIAAVEDVLDKHRQVL